MASPSKKTESFPTSSLSRSHQLWRRGRRLPQNPFMSPFLNCESPVMDTTAKVASLPFIVSNRTDHRTPKKKGIQALHVPQTSVRSLLVVQTTSCISAALCRSLGHRHHHRPLQQHRLKTSTRSLGQRWPRTPIWSLVADWPVDINVASGSSTDQGYMHDFDGNRASINTAAAA